MFLFPMFLWDRKFDFVALDPNLRYGPFHHALDTILKIQQQTFETLILREHLW